MIAALIWTFLAVRLIFFAIKSPILHPIEGPLPEDLPPIDLIVPARNEEAVVENALGSIVGQEYSSVRVIAVDDESNDETLAILQRMASQEPRIRVIEGCPRPPGWVGKTWAVHQGFTESRADWIGFVDSDMTLHPRTLATAIVAARRESADMVSIMPRVVCRSFWQGSIAISLLQILAQLYPLPSVNKPRSRSALAAGGFILIRRDAYILAGGHEAGRHDIVDDIQLARRVKANGGRLFVGLAPDLGSTHMYGSFGAIWRGLRKNAYAGMDYQFHKFVFGAIGAIFLAWAPLVTLTRGIVLNSAKTLGLGLWGCIAQWVAFWPLTLFLRIHPLFALTAPLGMTAYLAIATSSVWHHHRGRILWKDRTLSAAEVQAGVTGKTRTGES